MFKKILGLFIFVMVIASGCSPNGSNNDLYNSIIKRDKLIVGISLDAKPFGFKDSNGNVEGMEADLAREVAKRILGSKDKVVFKNIIPQDRIKAAMSGDVDMVIATLTINSQRKKMVTFSNPYFVAGQVLCVKKDSKIDSLDDLLNKRIIVILGTTGEKNIRQFAPNALIQGYSDNTEALNAFKLGLNDAITTDDSLLQGFVMENDDYVILPKRLTKEPYGIAFKRSRQTESFKKSINQIINDMSYDGTLDAIKEKWQIN